MKTLMLTLPLVAASCATAGGLTRLDAMDDAEFDRYTTRVSAQVGAVAGAAVAEGDLDAQSASVLAGAIRSLGGGSVAGVAGALSQTLQMDSYGVVGLTIAVTELDAALEERGAYDEGGVLGPRAVAVLEAVASAIEGAAAPPEPPE